MDHHMNIYLFLWKDMIIQTYTNHSFFLYQQSQRQMLLWTFIKCQGISNYLFVWIYLITPTPTYLFITRAKAKDAKIIIHQMPRPKVIIKCKKLKKTGKSCTKMDALHEHSPSKEDWPKGVWRTRSWIAIKNFMMLCPSPKPSDLYHQSQDQISGVELCWRHGPPQIFEFFKIIYIIILIFSKFSL